MAQNSLSRPKAQHYRLVPCQMAEDDTPFNNAEQPSPPLPTPSPQQQQQQHIPPHHQQQQHIMLPHHPQQQLQPQQHMMPDLTANMNMTSLQDQVNMFHQQMAQQFPQPMMPFPNMSLMGQPNNMAPLGMAPNNMAPLGMPVMANLGPLPVMKQDASGRRQMELQLDMTGFRPEDVLINTDGNMLDIYAKSSSVDGTMRREFRRQFTMPETINAENLRCLFTPDGVLTIEGHPGVKPAITLKSPKKRKRVTFALTNDP